MRDAAVRLLSWLSGACVAVGVVALLGIVEELVGPHSDYGRPPDYFLLNAPLIVVAWLFVRRPLRPHRIGRSVAASATLVSIVLVFRVVILSFGNTKSAARVTAMKGDLLNLVAAEESFLSDSGRYTTNLTSLGFKTSPGVENLRISLTPHGWTAGVAHRQSERTCVIFVGETPIAPATVEGESRCSSPFDPTGTYVMLAAFGAAALCAGLAHRVITRAAAPSPS